MAINPAVTKLNTRGVYRVGNRKWVFGNIAFSAADVYATGGFDPRQQIRKLFGVGNVDAILFLGSSSDGSGAQSNATSRVQGRFKFVPGTAAVAQSGTVYLYAVGRTTGSTVNASEVELAAGDSVNNLTMSFWAICSGEGFSGDSVGLT